MRPSTDRSSSDTPVQPMCTATPTATNMFEGDPNTQVLGLSWMAPLFPNPARTDLTLQQRMAEGTFDEKDAVDIELQPGQMSMHDVHMIHGAQANRSAQRRTGVALRYMPASSHFDRSLNPVDGQSGVPVSFATRPLWLLRGRDVSGLNDFKTGHRPV